jgi:hypothetical protein
MADNSHDSLSGGRTSTTGKATRDRDSDGSARCGSAIPRRTAELVQTGADHFGICGRSGVSPPGGWSREKVHL